MAKKRAAAYIRVSTDKDSQLHSYDFQEHYWQGAFENDPDTELVGIYADKGISGHSIQKRPQFLVMMEDARQHKFDRIYTKSVSRFARNTTQLLEAVRELRDIGIEVVFEKENIHTFDSTSEIFLTIAATIAENDLEVDSERMRWSVQHRYENGFISIGSGLYGYRMTPENELVVIPEEAATVKYVFDAYVNVRYGSKRIADALNEAGVPTRSGMPWSAFHIGSMIRNEKYKGDALMGKKVCHLGEYKLNRNGEYAPKHYIEDSHEAIVDKDTWETAQRIMDDRGRNFDHTYVRHTFSSMVECGCCGKKYSHKIMNSGTKYQSDVWACGTALKKNVSACDNSRIKDTVLKEKFVEAYNEFVTKRPLGDSITAMQEAMEDLKQQERELAELIMRHLISKTAYDTERKDIKRMMSGIKKKIDERRIHRVPESEHVPITAFDSQKVKRFITKVIVKDFTVTFAFYNGARITKNYTNGQPGNKIGWKKGREDA